MSEKLTKVQFWLCFATSVAWLLSSVFGLITGDETVFMKLLLSLSFAVSASLYWQEIKRERES
jgi:hypothetical protein